MADPCHSYALEPLAPGSPDTSDLLIVGRLRIELPQYRVRGLCRMLYSPSGALRIDFRHSSLFGALREDATLLMNGGVFIYDRERRQLFDSDSALAVLRRSVGAPIKSDDLMHALLMIVPRCSDIDSPRVAVSRGAWELVGIWRGRRVEMEGKNGEGLHVFRQCFAGEGRCYSLHYYYGRAMGHILYPMKIRLSREGSNDAVALEITEVKRVARSQLPFDLESIVAQ